MFLHASHGKTGSRTLHLRVVHAFMSTYADMFKFPLETIYYLLYSRAMYISHMCVA